MSARAPTLWSSELLESAHCAEVDAVGQVTEEGRVDLYISGVSSRTANPNRLSVAALATR
jgi:hypothetical protein